MLEKRKPIKRKGFRVPFSLKLNPALLFAFLIGCGMGFVLYPALYNPWLTSSTDKAHIRACFSPEGHCTDKIVSAINDARSSILVMAYALTSSPIAQALAEAYARGVDVKILVDRSQLKEKYSQLPFLLQKRIPMFIDHAVGIAHNKIMIFDERWVQTGSFNFSRAAETKNAENVLLIDDPSLAQIYKKNWEARANNARKLPPQSFKGPAN